MLFRWGYGGAIGLGHQHTRTSSLVDVPDPVPLTLAVQDRVHASNYQTQALNVMERRARMAVPRMLGRQSSLAGAALQRGSGWGVLRRQRVVV